MAIRTFAVILFTLSILLSGCAAKNVVVHPGSLNAFDSQAYDVLRTTQDAIEAAKKEVATSSPELKATLNHVIDVYNSAEIAFKAYHKAAADGKPADTVALSSLLNDLSTAARQIVAKFKTQPKPVVAPGPTASFGMRRAA